MTQASRAKKPSIAATIRIDAIVLVHLLLVGAIPLVGAVLAGANPGTAVVILPYALAIAASAIFAASRSCYYVFKMLLLLVVFQELGLIVLSNSLGTSEIRFLTLGKDIFAISALATLVLRGRFRRIRWHAADWLALGFILLNGLYFLRSLGSVSLFALALALKQNSMLCLLYFLGRLLFLSENDQRKSVSLLVKISLFIALFGFVERFLLGDDFWIAIGIHQLARDRGVYDVFLRSKFEGLAGAMFYLVGNLSMRRLASLSAQPPLTAYFLALPLTILFFVPDLYSKDRLKASIATMVIGIALLLTLGRGGLLIAALAFLAKYWKKNSLKFAGIVALLLLLYFGSSQVQYIFGYGGGRHLGGLQNALVILQGKPLGYGLGTGGNYAAWFGDSGASSLQWESYIGALGYQMGIIGLVVFTLLFTSLFYMLYWQSHPQVPLVWQRLSAAVGVAVLGLLGASLFAEAAVGFLSSGFYLIFAGMMVSQIDRFGYREKGHGIGRS